MKVIYSFDIDDTEDEDALQKVIIHFAARRIKGQEITNRLRDIQVSNGGCYECSASMDLTSLLEGWQ